MTELQREETEKKGWIYIGSKIFKKMVKKGWTYRTYKEIK